MAAQHYSQYFNIDEKYYAVVTKDLIDKGEVKWEGFFPHETFIQLLHQTVDMLSDSQGNTGCCSRHKGKDYSIDLSYILNQDFHHRPNPLHYLIP